MVEDSVDIKSLVSGNMFGVDEIRRLENIRAERSSELKEVLRPLEEEIEEGDQSVPKQLRAGVLMHLIGKNAQAQDKLAKLTSDPVASFYHGQTLMSLERYTEAAEAFQRAEDAGFELVQCLLARAGAVRAGGDPASAEKLLKKASDKGGATRAEYCYQKGCIASDLGDTYGALEYFERTVDMDPLHSRALFWLANENARRGNDDEAIRLYEQSLSKPPLHLASLINLGLLYEDIANFPAAAFCFRRVLEAYPRHPRALLYMKDIEASTDMYYDEDSIRNQARLKQILEVPVTDFELSVRARNCLQKMGVKNLGDLTALTEQDLLSGKNFGETSLQEIKDMMATKGLRLGQALQKERREYNTYQAENLSPQQVALLAKPVGELNLSVRARKCMARLNITTLGELTSRSADDLLESKNFGVTSLNEVRAKLTEMSLRLRNE